MVKLPRLTVKKEEAERKIKAQIEKGKKILGLVISNQTQLDQAKIKRSLWSQSNVDLFAELFDDATIITNT